MESFWRQICDENNVNSVVMENWLERIKSKYVESHRCYHNENVIVKKILFLKNFSKYIQFATIFQYYDFDPKNNCVENNCKAFKEFVADANIEDEKFIKFVLKLLGDETQGELDGFVEEWEYFQDLDLIILGSPVEEYKEYTNQLREEYNNMDIENYNKLRSKILRTFLTIPFIYSTKLFRDIFEETARNNIKNEIAELSTID